MASYATGISFFLVFLAVPASSVTKYSPTWESLDARPLPVWYDEAKIGIFLHFGVFSVPSYRSEWFWDYWQGTKEADVVKFMKDNYRPDFTYADFAADFTAEFFNANEWADIFQASGAKYVVLTSKHHEGFTNWPSKYAFNWNSMDVGPKRDIVGELATAVRSKPNMTFGLYHSLFEWFNPLFLQDQSNNFTTNDFVKFKTMPELYELINTYKPELIWSDGDWVAPDTYWQSQEFIAWLYNESPVKDTVVINDRWGKGDICHHGGYYTCQDRYHPGTLQKHKFEDAMTLDKSSWGFRRNATLDEYLTIEELVDTLVTTVSCGGNLLMNVGPTKDGRIIPLFQERLKQMGQWLSVNGEAIYSTRPWQHQNDTVTKNVWYTSRKEGFNTVVYAISLGWPDGDTLVLGAPMPTRETSISLLGYPGTISWALHSPTGISIQLPIIPYNKVPCQWAFTFKLTGLI